jgi:hypothetical protein
VAIKNIFNKILSVYISEATQTEIAVNMGKRGNPVIAHKMQLPEFLGLEWRDFPVLVTRHFFWSFVYGVLLNE